MSELLDKSIILAATSIVAGIIAYFYKLFTERKRNKKITLYYLFEVWFRLSVFYRNSFDLEFDKLRNELDSDYPELKMSDEQFQQAKNEWSKIIFKQVIDTALSDFNEIVNELESSIKNIAYEDPVLAYKLNIGKDTNRAQKYLIGYSEQVNKHPDISKLIENNIINGDILDTAFDDIQNIHMYKILQNFEQNIVLISKSIGLITHSKSKKLIKSRKQQIQEIDDDLYLRSKKMVSQIFFNIQKSLASDLTKT